MALNVDISKKEGENDVSLLRRFSSLAKKTGVLRKARDVRYFSRPHSDSKRRKQKLGKLKKQAEYEYKTKMGL